MCKDRTGGEVSYIYFVTVQHISNYRSVSFRCYSLSLSVLLSRSDFDQDVGGDVIQASVKCERFSDLLSFHNTLPFEEKTISYGFYTYVLCEERLCVRRIADNKI